MIDWQQVRGLRDEVGEDDFIEIVTLFVEEVEALIVRLRQAGCCQAVEQDLHSLKGSALNLGFSALSALCQRGEASAARGTCSAEMLEGILCCYHTSLQMFLERLAQAGYPTPVYRTPAAGSRQTYPAPLPEASAYP
nr:Hpt domain-containing protein [Sulfitobacter alexandrii]